jgi:hypothetical protein
MNMKAKIFAGVVVSWIAKCENFVWFCLQARQFFENNTQSRIEQECCIEMDRIVKKRQQRTCALAQSMT